MGGGLMGPTDSPKLHGHDRYEVEDGVRTMERAEEIKSKPSLHHAVKKHAAKKARMMKSIAGKR